MQTPRGNRIHIGIFGRRNAGKSSLINALTGQDLAIVSPTPGTTADPVFKSMELHPAGPVVFVDTAGFDDEGSLGSLRVDKTRELLDRIDLALLVVDGIELAADAGAALAGKACTGPAGSGEGKRIKAGETAGLTGQEGASLPGRDAAGPLGQEKKWLSEMVKKKVPVILAVNKWEALQSRGQRMCLRSMEDFLSITGPETPLIPVSALSGEGIDSLRAAIISSIPEQRNEDAILEELLPREGLVLLVMPQDIQAPKGRLILPQVQTIRKLLDQKCTVVSTTADGLERSLDALAVPPELIITDSQCFGEVWEKKPDSCELTSFSILMAAAKGEIEVFVKGALSIDDVIENLPFRVLIAEACTHVPQGEDIGTVKIPRLLRKTFGEGVEIVNVRGNDFPDREELENFDLIIHCGACMFNRQHVLSRISAAEEAGVPITNYGVFLAKMSGILDKIRL